jgi:hypothetical protein
MYEKTAERALGAGNAIERDRSPVEVLFERLAEQLEKTHHVFSSLEGRIEGVLASAPAQPPKSPLTGVETAAGSKIEEHLQRLINQANGLTERIVTVIDRVRL